MAKQRKEELKNSVLGKKISKFEFEKPSSSILETFQNRYPNRNYSIELKIPEFTCLCPLTGQPDFATICIKYIPDKKCIESKSLKLYFFSFRNFSEFHEDCVNRILEDLVCVCEPNWIHVEGKFNARGGISITPRAEYLKDGFELPLDFKEKE